MNWALMFDNPKKEVYNEWLFNQARNFIDNFNSIIQFDVYEIQGSSINCINLKNGEKTNPKFQIYEGAIISFSNRAIAEMTNSDLKRINFVESNNKSNLPADLLLILKKLKTKTPIVLCTGKYAYQHILHHDTIFKGYHLFYQPRQAINWFNYKLIDKINSIL